ncbi:hypothetical protein KHA80_02565 [Anaerobacillus sp. HL2]|nr:hypothetical protein KHA80_02565 [Anaerobacillus sp. HL2]
MGKKIHCQTFTQKGFYQQQKYMTLSNHNYLGYVVLVDPKYWSKIPEGYQRKYSRSNG